MKGLGAFDLLAYPRAIVLLARNPQIVLAPLLGAVAEIVLYKLVPADGGVLGVANGSLESIVAQLISSFALAVAIIGGEDAWRYGKAPVEDAYAQARRRAGDIFVAAIGYAFLTFIAGMVGGVLGPIGSLVLTAAAAVLCIYMLPAAAIGGIPGGATLQISAERVRNAPLAAVTIAAVYFASIVFVPVALTFALEPLRFGGGFFGSGDVSSLIVALAKSVVWAYVAIVIAKVYGDASYGRYRRY